MKTKLKIITLVSLTFILIVFLLPLILNNNQVLAQEIPSVPGETEAIGTYFETKNSEYLNITLESTEEIKIILESIPKMISMDISSSTNSTSTFLTLEGLEPNKIYYKYQDSYKNGTVLISDENGTSSWQQDLTQSHHTWIQEEKGTIFLPNDCSSYGNWNTTTQTCTLTQDLSESVEITANNIILDCNSHKITGISGYGILLSNRTNSTVKNCTVSNFHDGIRLSSSNNNTIIHNIAHLNWDEGIALTFSSYDNRVINNFISSNVNNGIGFHSSSNNNKIYHNNFVDNQTQAKVYYSAFGNLFDNGYPSGGNYWSDYTEADLYSGPNQDQPGSDGIGDSPFNGILACNGYYCFVKGVVVDRYPFMKENGWEVLSPPQPKNWSFAVITDLHIGWGIPDYDSEGYNDNLIGQDYYITERLRKTVNWLNKNYKNPDYNIKFVVVAGDVSDTAEYSEFITARDILNKLEIPYIPITGNHDIWPYIQKITAEPDNRIFGIKDKRKDGEPLGDDYFERVFWQENATNTQRIKNLFGNFERQEETVGYIGAPYFQNHAFSYRGVNFISLDFAPRDYFRLITAPVADLQKTISLKWLEEIISNHESEKNVIFTHYPFKIGSFLPLDRKEISDVIRNCNCEVFNFAGHTHVNKIGSPGDEYIVAETEPVSQIPLDPFYTLTGESIRLVRVSGDEAKEIDYSKLIDTSPPPINPYITTNTEEPAVDERIRFVSHSKSLEPEDIFSYDWDFDKNYSSECKRKEGKNSECVVIYSQPGRYKVTLKVVPNYDKTYSEEVSWYLKVKEEARPRFRILPSISDLMFLLNGEEINLTQEENAQNTTEWALTTEATLPAKPIGAFQIHFERVDQDIDFSNLSADIDFDTKKSILYMPEWPSVIENEKMLFIPK